MQKVSHFPNPRVAEADLMQPRGTLSLSNCEAKHFSSPKPSRRAAARSKDKRGEFGLCVFRCGLIYASNDWPGGLLWPLPVLRLKLTDGSVRPIPSGFWLEATLNEGLTPPH